MHPLIIRALDRLPDVDAVYAHMVPMSIRCRAAVIAAIALSAALLLAGCSGAPARDGSSATSTAEQVGGTRSFEADNGTVRIPTDPQRIVTIGSAAVFLGFGVNPVGMASPVSGRDMAWLTPEQKTANDKAMDLGRPPDVDYEKLASLEPDLIVVHIPQHAWDGKAVDEARLKSIAPTVFIVINNAKWKDQDARVADAVGHLDGFNKGKEAYDRLVAEIKDEYGALLDSTNFVALNRWSDTTEGSFAVEYSESYCTSDATEVGLKFPKPPREGLLSDVLPMERMSDFATYDAIFYPLGPGGKPKSEFVPVLDSNVWKTLPNVAAGRAFGVTCNTALTYPSRIQHLTSVEKALGELATKK